MSIDSSILLVLLPVLAVLLLVAWPFMRREMLAKPTAAAPAPAPAPTPAPVAAAGQGQTQASDPLDDPRLRAVLVAAISAVIKEQFRVTSAAVHIDTHHTAWSQEGRRAIFSSHQVR